MKELEELQMQIREIINSKSNQAERSILVAKAMEKFRQTRNRQRQEQQKKFMDYVNKFRQEQKLRQTETNKQILQNMAGTELFDRFVKKFTKENQNER